MKHSLIIVYSVLAILVVIAYFLGGSSIILEGLNKSVNTAIHSTLMLIASFVVIGQLTVLLTADVIEKWLQKFKGVKAIIISAIAGGLFPGGPYIYYPFVSSFREKKLPFYIFIAFIFGKQTYDFSRIPMEASLVGIEIAIIRNLITLPIPIIAGLLAQRFWGTEETLNSFLKASDKNDSNNNHS